MATDYPSDWNTRRKKVYSRDGFKCQNCGGRGGPKGNRELHAHHIVPKSKGGSHKISNLVTVCRRCHNAIHGNSKAPQQPRDGQKTIATLIDSFLPELQSLLLNSEQYKSATLTVFSQQTLENGNIYIEKRDEMLNKCYKISRMIVEYESGDKSTYPEVILKEFRLFIDSVHSTIRVAIEFVEFIEKLSDGSITEQDMCSNCEETIHSSDAFCSSCGEQIPEDYFSGTIDDESLEWGSELAEKYVKINNYVTLTSAHYHRMRYIVNSKTVAFDYCPNCGFIHGALQQKETASCIWCGAEWLNVNSRWQMSTGVGSLLGEIYSDEKWNKIGYEKNQEDEYWDFLDDFVESL